MQRSDLTAPFGRSTAARGWQVPRSGRASAPASRSGHRPLARLYDVSRSGSAAQTPPIVGKQRTSGCSGTSASRRKPPQIRTNDPAPAAGRQPPRRASHARGRRFEPAPPITKGGSAAGRRSGYSESRATEPGPAQAVERGRVPSSGQSALGPGRDRGPGGLPVAGPGPGPDQPAPGRNLDLGPGWCSSRWSCPVPLIPLCRNP